MKFLFKMKKYNIKKGIQVEKPTNTENCFYGSGWKVEKNANGFLLSFLAAKQGGDEIIIEINEEIFNEARNGKHDLKSLINKFNLKF